MSDKVDTTSLTNLATLKGKANREGADLRAKNFSSQATGRAGFDGFLQTFLGKDKGKSGSARNSLAGQLNKDAASRKKSAAAGKMDPGQKKALRKSMDKTVSDAADQGEAEDPQDVRAAVQEAARLIWSLLYGGGELDDGQGAMAGGGSVRQLSDIINAWGGRSEVPGALSGMGASLLDPESLQQAIETANASAEMNAAAVLSALDDLLDGMPREALEEALAGMAGEWGGQGGKDLFNRIAASLDAEILSLDTGVDLLSMLGGRNGASLAAENAGLATSASDILALFQEFVDAQGPITDTGANSGEDMLRSFSAWLQETGKAGKDSGLLGDMSKLGDALLRAAGLAKPGETAASRQTGVDFSAMESELESLLQTLSVRTAATGGQEGAAAMASGIAQDMGQAGGQAAMSAQPSQAAPAMSGMLDQINNIERLAEAMRMANKGPVKNLTMQLSPPELGKVMLRVESRDGVVSAYLRVEKPEAAAQLANNLAQLRENLKAHGIELGDLDIQQRGQHEALGDFSGQRHGRGTDGEYGEMYGTGRSDREADSQTENAPATESILNDDGTLNLIA